MNQTVRITASLHGKIVYMRKLSGYLSPQGLELAIVNAVQHDFKNFDIRVERLA